jgi:hypothetical protein
MEEFFVTKSSAIQRIAAMRQGLIKKEEKGESPGAAAERQSRIDELAQLLVDVRAGRVVDFLLPAATGTVRIFVSPG